ncbi:DUF2235 domain-containing protein [Croceibacterium ferulae]|uniref:DUF2235 domain-containing protein n=1 Tax=Croceibacterium ferulae TaxID=1854641 RepID=UPI0013904FB0|nr:DUF2235 domain-containing protein [Croceibacterium ferulae]
MEHDEAARAGPDAPAGRAIVLFSDGTGNSSAKLFKTNVWRMYEAVDLGPAAAGKRKQIAFYDNGVGTSALRPVALLAGIFGFGLRRNILELYRFACRNYRPAPGQRRGGEPPAGGDAIYGFGFSRGAFTMRLVIALIASQGLVAARDEADLHRLTRDAYRAFRADFLPRKLQWPTRAWRRLRGWLIAGWRIAWRRRRYNRADNYRPEIRFIGVWDTVAAYGGPIVEITRGIDNWLYALSMPDYCLNPRVQCARHALAIDDARDAFHPLLWDEVNEGRLVAGDVVAPDRLRQVWFTGMHADVGGGYPDESLSFVSFLWMMEEANKAGLRTLDIITDRFRALANSAGPLHDSRAGMGAYYRYQPRNIAAWLNEPGNDSIIADPDLPGAAARQKGLLTRVRVHESVAARIGDGTDGYAPINLPARLTLMPEGKGETVALADSESPRPPPPADAQTPQPMVAAHIRARMEDGTLGQARADALEPAWDRVWLRRVAYFLTLAVTLLLVLMPWMVEHLPNPPVLADGRSWGGGVIRLLDTVLPGMLHRWIDTFADNSFWFLVLVAAIGALQVWSGRLDRRMRDTAREVWRATLMPNGPSFARPDTSWVKRLRTSALYRRSLRFIKWRVLPAIAALLLAALLVWLAIGLATQLRLPSLERGQALCPRPLATQPLQQHSFALSTRATCTSTGLRVRSGARYAVELEVIGPQWQDGGMPTTPRGRSAGELGVAGRAGVLLRRVIGANYLQPVIAIRRGPGLLQFGDRVHIEPLVLRQDIDCLSIWHGSFTAPRGGELVLFVNEAVPPLLLPADFFYTHEEYGNTGAARVTIRLVDPMPGRRVSGR